MKTSSKEIAIVDPQMLAELKDMYPQETGGFNRIKLPRLSYFAQDVIEGKGKTSKVVIEAGTFFEEHETDEVNPETKKKVWDKKEIGPTFDGIILYHRYQLSFYDEATELYTSSPVFDSQDEVMPLWCDGKQIAKGTPAELKKLYKFVGEDGKEKSKLKDNRIVYVLYKNELFQLNLHGSSMYSFMKYVRTVNPPTVITTFASEFQEKGKIQWNMMTFNSKNSIAPEMFPEIVARVKEIKMAIQLEKGVSTELPKKYDEVSVSDAQAEEEFKKW